MMAGVSGQRQRGASLLPRLARGAIHPFLKEGEVAVCGECVANFPFLEEGVASRRLDGVGVGAEVARRVPAPCDMDAVSCPVLLLASQSTPSSRKGKWLCYRVDAHAPSPEFISKARAEAARRTVK